MTDTTDYSKIPEVLAVLPLRNIVVFPGMIVPLFVGRDKSIRALEDVMADDKQIMLVAQRDGDLDDSLRRQAPPVRLGPAGAEAVPPGRDVVAVMTHVE